LPGLIVSDSATRTVLMSGTQTESSDIGSHVSSGDYPITVSGTQICEGTIGLEVGPSASGTGPGADPMPIRVVNADEIFRDGNTVEASLAGYTFTHGGLDTGDNKVYDLGVSGIVIDSTNSFYSEAATSDKLRLMFKPTNYMAERIMAKIFDNVRAGKYDMPTGQRPWNLFSSSADYTTSNCMEWQEHQWLKAINDVDAELSGTQKTTFEATYFSGGSSAANLVSPIQLETPELAQGYFEAFMLTVIARVDLTVQDYKTKWDNDWEGTVNQTWDGMEWQEQGVLDAITPKSFDNSPYFKEVPY